MSRGIGSLSHLASSSQTIEARFIAGRRFVVGCIAALAALFLGASGARAQVGFGSSNVGVPAASKAVPVIFPAGGTYSTASVLTLGQSGLDFAVDSALTTCSSGSPVPSGGNCSIGVTFTPTAPGIRVGAIVVLDGGGNVLGTTTISGTGLGALGTFVPGNVEVAAGQLDTYLGALGDGLQATSAELYLPSGVTLDGAGNLYIADTAHNRVRMVCAAKNSGIIAGTTGNSVCTAPGVIITVVGAGGGCNGQLDLLGDGCSAQKATVASPGGVAVDGVGNLYIADTGNEAVRVVNAVTGIITTFAGEINPLCTVPQGRIDLLGDGCPATSAILNQPQGVTPDIYGNIYIADTADNRIRVVSPAGIISTIAGGGAGCTGGQGGVGDTCQASQAKLANPDAVALDAAGDMYIADSSNNRVRVLTATAGTISSSSIITTFAGNGSSGYSGDGGPATSAQIYSPSAIAIDPAQNVYIADTQNDAVRMVSAGTLDIETIISDVTNQVYDPSTTPVSFSALSFYGPIGLAFDTKGNLYIGDSLNMVVQEMQSNLTLVDQVPPPATNVIRVNSTSPPHVITIENIGNAPLDLTAITAQLNAAVDAGTTTCNTGAPNLAVGGTCNVGAVFAPTVPKDPLITDIDVAGQTANSPLDIEIVGDAIPLNSTTTTVTSSANPSDFGQPVTFTVKVTTGIGTLTGTVAITDTFNGVTTTLKSGIAINTLDVATYVTSTLPVGIHTIVASYSGDANHTASTSTDNGAPPLLQTVEEATTITLTSSLNPSPVGQNVTFTATVAVSSAGGGVTPTGTVTFMNGATVIGAPQTPPPSGIVTFTTNALPIGSNPITAVYSGDATTQVAGITSAVLNQIVQAQSTINLVSSLNPSTFGTQITFTATVTSSSTTAATGKVTFMNGAASIGTGTLSGSPGTATLNISTLPVGTDNITAVYPGDNNNSGATSNVVPQVVNAASTATAVASSVNPSAFQQSVTFTVTVTAPTGSGNLTGTVTIADTFKGVTTNLATGLTLNGSGQATYATTTLAIGLHSIVASYSGDTDHAVSSSTALTQTVQEGTTTALTSSLNPSTQGQNVTFTATVTAGPGGVTPDGTVTFMNGAVAMGAPVTLTAGVATFATTTLPIGLNSITAVFSGDAANGIQGSTSNAVSQDVQAATTIAVTSSLNPSNFGAQVTFTTTITSASTVAATGSVMFLDNGVQIGTGTLSGTPATAAYQTSTLTVGTHPITVSYAGDTDNAAGTSPVFSQVVTTTPTTTTVNAAPNPAIAGVPVAITATVTSNVTGVTPTGTVTFTAGTRTLGQATLTNGTATINPALAAGTYMVIATFGTSGTIGGSASAPYTLVVNTAASGTVLTITPNPAPVTATITFTATVTGNGVAPTGTVTFMSGTTVLGTRPLTNGAAVYTTSSLTAGIYSITAVYSGDANNGTNTSPAVSLTVTLIPTTTDLVATSTSGIPPQVLLVGVVTGSTGPIPTGTVTFTTGTTTLGSATLDTSGVASFTPNLPNGVFPIVASYSGDSLHAPSQSPPVSVNGAPAGFSITVKPSTVSMAASQNDTVAVNIASVGGFSDTIALGCAALPAGVTCTFIPSSVTLAANGSATSQLTIDTNSPLSGGSTAMNSTRGRGMSLAGLFLPFSVIFGLIFWRLRRRSASLLTMVLIAVLSLGALVATGCNSFGASTVTPGTYTFEVTGIGTQSNTIHYATVNLTITK